MKKSKLRRRLIAMLDSEDIHAEVEILLRDMGSEGNAFRKACIGALPEGCSIVRDSEHPWNYHINGINVRFSEVFPTHEGCAWIAGIVAFSVDDFSDAFDVVEDDAWEW